MQLEQSVDFGERIVQTAKNAPASSTWL